MRLHHLHAPQVDMLECKLEILSYYSSSDIPAHLNMQPRNLGSVQTMYWQVILWWIYMARLHLHEYLAGGVEGYLHKASFVLYL